MILLGASSSSKRIRKSKSWSWSCRVERGGTALSVDRHRFNLEGALEVESLFNCCGWSWFMMKSQRQLQVGLEDTRTCSQYTWYPSMLVHVSALQLLGICMRPYSDRLRVGGMYCKVFIRLSETPDVKNKGVRWPCLFRAVRPCTTNQ